jgi:hypothetical protein
MFDRFPSPRRFLAVALAALLVGTMNVLPARAQDEGQPVYAHGNPLINQAKQQMIFDEVRRERVEAREFERHARKTKTHRSRGVKAGNAVDEDIAAGRLVTGAKSETKAARYGVNGTLISPTNVKLNDKTGDAATAGQAEQRSAIVGKFGIACWNDGQGFNFSPAHDVMGCGYTTNGGATWVKTPAVPPATLGEPPHFGGSAAETWTSDPVVAANEKTGDFYFESLDAPGAGLDGVGVIRASFPGGVFTWDTPRSVVSYSGATDFADKEWMAADSSNGNLYVTWTHFTTVDDKISFSRSTDNGVTWSPEVVLSDPTEAGWVQGSRVEVGPNGEVYVCWSTLGGYIGSDADFIMMRKSTDGGLTFAAEQVVTSQYSNFGTGAPGFNRQRGITFPSLGVDRSTGPKRGRLYVAFEDCVNWYDDPLGGLGNKNELENNGFFAAATPFIPGQRLRGAIASTADLDYWSFSATQGTTYIFWTDSLKTSMTYSMRIFCTDTTGGGTRLAGSGDLSNPGRQGFIVWTAPTTATYYLRFAPGSAGGYRVETGIDSPSGPPERSRDLRDDFVTYSDDAITWSNPTQVNDDPPYYDNWLPEVQVGCDGYPYVMWYDFRDAVPKCGGVANIYATRSIDGGNTWAPNQIITTAQTNFTTAASNIAPNQGDYNGMYGGKIVSLAWGDGRLGDVDVWGGNIVTGPGVVCPNDSSALANSTYVPCFQLVNSNVVFADTYSFTITGDRNWPGLPINGVLNVPPASSLCLSPSISIPDTAATGDVHLCMLVNCVNGGCPVKCCVTLHVVNPVTSTLASLVNATADHGVVNLMWDVATSSPVRVYRSLDGKAWDFLASVAPDGTHLVTYTDATVTAGRSYGYRLGIPQIGGESPAGETWVDVHSDLTFALNGVRPNPTNGPLNIAFSLPDNSPATLELVDIGGRRVFTREVGTMGGGFHVVPVQNSNLPIGIYAVRLTQHGRTLKSKVTVVR